MDAAIFTGSTPFGSYFLLKKERLHVMGGTNIDDIDVEMNMEPKFKLLN